MSISVETYALAKKYTDEHGGGGSGGTIDYNKLTNKPSINGVTLEGNKNAEDFGIKDGETPNIEIGEVTTLEAGSDATASITGQTPDLFLSLGIPAGKQGNPGTPGTDGQTPNITIGQVDTLPSGSNATASITGETPDLVLNMGIPKGADGDGLPPTDDVPENYVLTPAGWAEPTGGGGKPWRLINTINLIEPSSTVMVSQDSDGNPFEVDELLIRGWLTCAESSRQNANIGVNGSYNNLAGNLPLIKNVGYFGPCEIHIYDDCGYFRADVFYTDAATASDPPAFYQYIQSMRAVDLPTFPYAPYSKISNFAMQCTSVDVEFGQKCLFQIYGR